MARDRSDRQIRQWTRRSEKAIRYGLGERVSDWYCAVRDARRGLPEITAAENRTKEKEAPGTPRMMFLGHLGVGRIEREWIVYQAEIAGRLAELREQQARLRAARAELDTANDRLADATVEPADAQLSTRVAGEEGSDEGIVRQRRLRAHRARLEQERGTVAALIRRIETIEARIAELEEQLATRLRVARRRAAMIDAHTRRRCAAYLTRLVRKHPDGKQVNALLRPWWPELPRWTREDERHDALSASRPEPAGARHAGTSDGAAR